MSKALIKDTSLMSFAYVFNFDNRITATSSKDQYSGGKKANLLSTTQILAVSKHHLLMKELHNTT